MPRLTLEEKKGLTIKRESRSSTHTYIPGNDPDLFHLLKDNRSEDESFSRIDKFWVNHYYYVGSERLCEKVFYPSGFGVAEINDSKDEKHYNADLYDRLLNHGIGLAGKRPIPNIEKPVKRLELECKPQRMRLECKE